MDMQDGKREDFDSEMKIGSPFGQAYSYFHQWLNVPLLGSGVVVIE